MTTKDISALSGVSVSTVGMILNGHGARYSEKTRQKVLRAAEQANYRPDISARGLRLKRSFLIGVSIFDANEELMAKLMRGIQKELSVVHYSALFFSHSSQDEEIECYHRCIDRAVEGIIINPGFYADGVAESRSSYLSSIGKIPVVEIFGHAVKEAPSVNIDEFSAGRQATEYLLSLGHRRIAMLTHDRYDKSKETGTGLHADAWHRYQGYRHALNDAKQKALIDAGTEPIVFTHSIHGEFEWEKDFLEGGFASLDAILNHPLHPTAVVCLSDWEAMGLIRAAEMRKIQLPAQLSIIGCGDLQAGRLLQPRLTTFSVPAYEVGRQAAKSLLQLIEKKSFDDVLIEPTLCVQESTCANPAS
jgi:DNA-binding LacI/PurR family transcriptional regulator